MDVLAFTALFGDSVRSHRALMGEATDRLRQAEEKRTTERSQEIKINETRRRIKMGRVVATEYVSLDGVVEAPGGSEPTIEG
jgi:hypothetical protein